MNRRVVGIVATLVATVVSLATAQAALAIGDEEELARFGGTGQGAGQLSFPEGIALDPVTGHVYVVEPGGSRVSEFTPWGNFVKAFGWDVAPGAVNEQQEVRVKAAEGQFRLSLGGPTTADLPFNATGAEVEAALNGLASIGGAGGSVNVKAVPGTTDGTTPYVYVVAFKGSLAGTNVAQLAVLDGTTPLDGGDPSTSFEARTRADGHGPTTGLESCTAESGCKSGLSGPGAGQLADARGVAVDATGAVYVKEVGNLRVQKFDSAGRFSLMFGGEVNKTTGEDRCAKAQLEGGDVCGVGVPGGGDGELGASNSSGIAISPGGGALRRRRRTDPALQLRRRMGSLRACLDTGLGQSDHCPFPGDCSRQRRFLCFGWPAWGTR